MFLAETMTARRRVRLAVRDIRLLALRLLSHRLPPEDSGGGYHVKRELGRWVVRPVRGWRSVPWITLPLYADADKDAAVHWVLVAE